MISTLVCGVHRSRNIVKDRWTQSHLKFAQLNGNTFAHPPIWGNTPFIYIQVWGPVFLCVCVFFFQNFVSVTLKILNLINLCRPARAFALSLSKTFDKVRRPSQGDTCSLVPLEKMALFPKNKILIFYVPCSPKLPVFPLFLGICSSVPQKQMPLFPCSPKRLGGPQWYLVVSSLMHLLTRPVWRQFSWL